MKEEISWEIITLNPDGTAVLRYKHKDYGTQIYHTVLPVHMDKEFVKQHIARSCPVHLFQAAKNAKEGKTFDLRSGFFEVEFDAVRPAIIDPSEGGTRKHLNEDFSAWYFTLNRDQRRYFNNDEILSSGKDFLGEYVNQRPVVALLRVTPIFTSGKWVVERAGTDPITVTPRQQPTFTYMDIPDARNLSFLALEDDSSYICVSPRNTKKWKRTVWPMGTWDTVHCTGEDDYVFVAKGNSLTAEYKRLGSDWTRKHIEEGKMYPAKNLKFVETNGGEAIIALFQEAEAKMIGDMK